MTILLLPFMSCSAKLPVYALIAGAFFSKGNALVVLALYLIGILSGIVSGALFKKTIFKSKESQFLIELPPYRMPTTKATLIHVWERVKHFLVKAGTIILLMSVVLWFLMSFTFGLQMTDDPSQSIIGVIGSIIAPIFTPTGFPYWQAAVALIVGGIVAKEAVVSSLAMFYGFAEGAGAGKVFEILSQDFTTASAFSFLVFVLLYVPCFAAITTMKAELRSTKHWLFSIAFQLVFAYVASTIAYAAFNLLS
jgi:ferrous iron transport protein B